MNDDSEDLDDELDNSSNKKKEYDEIDLKYNIYADDENMTVYLKFHGFHTLDEINQFAEYIQSHLPLILFDSDIKH